MDCHRESNIAQTWSAFAIQQLSPGYGIYTARLFSYRLKEVVATHQIRVTNNVSIPFNANLETHSHDLPGMAGGLRECVGAVRLHPNLPLPLSPTIGNPGLTHTCATVSIPKFQVSEFGFQLRFLCQNPFHFVVPI